MLRGRYRDVVCGGNFIKISKLGVPVSIFR